MIAVFDESYFGNPAGLTLAALITLGVGVLATVVLRRSWLALVSTLPVLLLLLGSMGVAFTISADRMAHYKAEFWNAYAIGAINQEALLKLGLLQVSAVLIGSFTTDAPTAVYVRKLDSKIPLQVERVSETKLEVYWVEEGASHPLQERLSL